MPSHLPDFLQQRHIVPPVLRKGARVAVLGASIVAATGLTVLNIKGNGIIGTLKVRRLLL